MDKDDPAVRDTTAPPRLAGRRLLTIAAAAICVAVVWLAADSVLGVDIKAAANGATIQVTLPSVTEVVLLSGLAGWGLLALLERRGGGRRTWTIIAVAVLLVSLLVGPGAGIGTPAKLTLAALHLTAGLVLIPGLALSGRARRAR